MPPLRSSRVSKACTLCRRQKTRCYPSTTDDETCLRCETLAQTCSLSGPSSGRRQTTSISVAVGSNEHINSDAINDRSVIPNFQACSSIDSCRFERLERSVASLIERLDGDGRSWSQTEHLSDEVGAADHVDPAPVFQIRDAATEVGVGTPAITDITQSPQSSRRITDSIDASTARSLLQM
jgi:hypothetical protein